MDGEKQNQQVIALGDYWHDVEAIHYPITDKESEYKQMKPCFGQKKFVFEADGRFMHKFMKQELDERDCQNNYMLGYDARGHYTRRKQADGSYKIEANMIVMDEMWKGYGSGPIIQAGQ